MRTNLPPGDLESLSLKYPTTFTGRTPAILDERGDMAEYNKTYNYEDLRALAKKRLPKGLFEFIDRGAEDEVALRNNRESYDRIKMEPRTLKGVGSANTATQLFGRDMAMPVAISPTGIVGLVWFEGEIAAAKAAARVGIPYSLSTASITPVEAVAKGAPEADLWFQLYVWNKPELSLQLVDRAREAGYRVLIVTTDGAGGANREYNLHNQFTVPMKITPRATLDVLKRPRWIKDVMLRSLWANGIPTFANYPPEYQSDVLGRAQGQGMAALGNPVVTREFLQQLRERWKGPLLVKGLLSPEDAEAAVACGADGVIVSNHGGRTLDPAISAIDALPSVVQAVGSRVDVLIDSGVRRGSDVAKALALGAKTVMTGRFPIWGTAVGGVDGAQHALNIVKGELARVMIQLGCATVEEIGPQCLWRNGRALD